MRCRAAQFGAVRSGASGCHTRKHGTWSTSELRLKTASRLSVDVTPGHKCHGHEKTGWVGARTGRQSPLVDAAYQAQ